MTGASSDDPDDHREVVRVFCGWAGTVIWFVHGPLDYEPAGISAELASEMTAWEETFEDSLDEHYEWRTESARRRHVAEGARLAEALAGEIGSGFLVEYTPAGDATRHIASGSPPSNPVAARAFATMARDAEDEERRIRAALARGGRLDVVPSSTLDLNAPQ